MSNLKPTDDFLKLVGVCFAKTTEIVVGKNRGENTADTLANLVSSVVPVAPGGKTYSPALREFFGNTFGPLSAAVADTNPIAAAMRSGFVLQGVQNHLRHQ